MDYFFLETMKFGTPHRLVISYDIMCQWMKNLWHRCTNIYSPDNVIAQNPGMKRICAIPKFHLPAHVTACQVRFSLNWLPRVGRTDGEGPERLWSLFNGLALSTREMGPGSRRDTLDDCFGDHNWAKITGFGKSQCHSSLDKSPLMFH